LLDEERLALSFWRELSRLARAVLAWFEVLS
jgi:hypothetical protein